MEEIEGLAEQLSWPAKRPHFRRAQRGYEAGRGISSLAMAKRGEQPPEPLRITRRKARSIRVAVNKALRNSRPRSPRRSRFPSFPDHVTSHVRAWKYAPGPHGDAVRQWAREWRHKQMAPSLACDLERTKRLMSSTNP